MSEESPATSGVRHQNTVVVLLFAIVLLLVLNLVSRREVWSYAVIAPADDQLIPVLDNAGESGYEIVAARRATTGSGETAKASYEMILKKRRTWLDILPGSPLATLEQSGSSRRSAYEIEKPDTEMQAFILAKKIVLNTNAISELDIKAYEPSSVSSLGRGKYRVTISTRSGWRFTCEIGGEARCTPTP